jgi:hypothetical protein
MAALLVLLGVALERRQPVPYQRPRPGNTGADHDLLPTVATTLATSTSPSTTIEKVVVPKLVGMRLALAKDSLATVG